MASPPREPQGLSARRLGSSKGLKGQPFPLEGRKIGSRLDTYETLHAKKWPKQVFHSVTRIPLSFKITSVCPLFFEIRAHVS